ncbi:methyltransferase domain-containing protein [Limnohabitans sp. Rim8]|uniref:methyltransferase domain-containing protein n=1 Tax=Limnohabitans sp. Rim8 TaxID=1100718 RepID=UPI00260FD56D|nr:methyltransferase domain-containing protein [Limnohabitans sp. Rim8]
MQLLARWFSLFGLLLLSACSSVPVSTYAPKLGQMGKDVMWLPTRDELVTQMLTAAQVSPDDEVVDLGAGDGKIAIAAARQFGARAWGIEYNKDLAALAQRNAEKAGLAGRVRIVQGDIFKEDFSRASVVTLYLLEELNEQLRPTLLGMRPGTRVVSNTFGMGDWEPDQVIRVGSNTGYFWKVPAQLAGQWSVQGLDRRGPVRLALTQRHQRVGGTLAWGDKVQPLLGARMDGADLHFSFVKEDGQLQAVQVRVQGATMAGEWVAPYGMLEIQPAVVKVSAQRLGN